MKKALDKLVVQFIEHSFFEYCYSITGTYMIALFEKEINNFFEKVIEKLK